MLITAPQPTGLSRRGSLVLCWSGRGEAAHGVSHSPNQHVALEKVTLNAGWHLNVGKNTLQGHSTLKSDHPVFFFSHRARVHPGVYSPKSSKAAFLSLWKRDEVCCCHYYFSKGKTPQNRGWLNLLNSLCAYGQVFWTGLRVWTLGCDRSQCRGSICASGSPVYSGWTKSKAASVSTLQMIQNMSPLMLLVLVLGLMAEFAVSTFSDLCKKLLPLRALSLLLKLCKDWNCT